MRLHRLTLRDVKGVRERTVEFPDRGVVVIEGPNESGKSTMIEAFDALLSLKATSRSAGVRAMQPVDRDVAPFVEAELTIGGVRLRYAKRWLRQPATTLHVLGPRPEQLTGDAAQQRVDGLVKQHLDRTLWDALRLTQAGDGTVAPLVSSAVLTQALDAAAGAHQHADGAEVLLEQVEKEYALYLTPTGRPTGDYRAAMTRYTEAQHEVAETHRRVQDGMSLLDRQQAARERVVVARDSVADADARLADAERAGAEVEAVAAAHDNAAERLTHARDLQRASLRVHTQRQQLVGEVAALAARIEEAAAARQADVTAAEDLTAALLAAEEAASRAADAVEQVSDEVDAARADCDHLADVRQLAGAESVLTRATELVERVRVARASQPERPVERNTARRVGALQNRLDAMVHQHAAASPTLEVESLGSYVQIAQAADGGAVVSGDDDGHAGTGPVAPGGRRRVSVARDTTIEIPGRARVRIQLQPEALGRMTEIDELRQRLHSTLADLGVGHVDELETLAEATEQASAALREATRDLDALLRPLGAALATEAAGGVVPAALTDAVGRRRERVTAYRAARDGVRALPDDEHQLRVVVDRETARLRAARADQREANETLAARRREVAALTTRLDRAEGRIAADTARLDVLRDRLDAARTEATDRSLADLVVERAAWVSAASDALARAARAVDAADVEGVRTALTGARHQARLAGVARDETLADLHHVNGQVEMAAGEGRQELYDLAVAEFDDAERELQTIDRRARAVRHLHTALHRHRDAAHRTYVRPYTHALEELGRRVYGPDFAVTVDADLALSARTLDGVTVPFTDLSGGAKEQLGILARLAVARLVDPTQGVPVVIDDALGYSDPQRLRQMGEVLGSATDGDGDIQVVLLTCTPERYAAIPHVHTVRLSA